MLVTPSPKKREKSTARLRINRRSLFAQTGLYLARSRVLASSPFYLLSAEPPLPSAGGEGGREGGRGRMRRWGCGGGVQRKKKKRKKEKGRRCKAAERNRFLSAHPPSILSALIGIIDRGGGEKTRRRWPMIDVTWVVVGGGGQSGRTDRRPGVWSGRDLQRMAARPLRGFSP